MGFKNDFGIAILPAHRLLSNSQVVGMAEQHVQLKDVSDSQGFFSTIFQWF